MNATYSRIGVALFLVAAGLTLGGGGGCNLGQEGERCNPSLSHDECGAGLACTQPVDCPENYCCRTDGKSTDPNCQPGCNGGQGSICAAGGEADCPSGDDGGAGPGVDASSGDSGATE